MLGNYLEGWKLYESRLFKDDTKNNYYRFPQESWRGESDLAGKNLLVHCEQGLGDVIQFCRYLPLLVDLKINVIFEVPKELIRLMSTLDERIILVERGRQLPKFDAYCPLMSLPYVFKTTIETIPNKVPYLYTDREKALLWKEKLGYKSKKRIGIVWSTSSMIGEPKSIPLVLFNNIINEEYEWHSLQKEYRQGDINLIQTSSLIHDHSNSLIDFSDTAALIDCMDLIISVDTSVAHLAGALGKEVSILLPFMPDYRWMLVNQDCPWYPSVKLIRQDKYDNWSGVINLVENSLFSD
jgi:hypothetical protein